MGIRGQAPPSLFPNCNLYSIPQKPAFCHEIFVKLTPPLLAGRPAV
ncbi:hypothetical protein SUBVAR_06620 [Subdoligranulum variabile DSM 15176]|uniref:Uncharacterized protein n=1 Tax=Subdoligranulum variabile DSM 15176 TaxID=411471 RepID=D1PQF1_9FIRM|nr:hypothetical protein SUBVAR_06620 [Subdoligranulum variabile DSM 15176]